MDYKSVIPSDITNLSRYSVPRQLFICTCVVLILFLLLSAVLVIEWVFRTIKGYTNTDYIADYAIKYQAERTMKDIPDAYNSPQDIQFEKKCAKFSRFESRMLQFWCLVVIVAINVGTYTCGILQCAAFCVTVLFFFFFNVLRVSQNKALRTLWMVPLIACYLPYYIFDKNLNKS